MTPYRSYRPSRIERLADLCASSAHNIEHAAFRTMAAREAGLIDRLRCETLRTRKGDVATAARAMLSRLAVAEPSEWPGLAADLRSAADALRARGDVAIAEDWIGRRRGVAA